ncbi:MAG: D-glycero-beta-D-manno-heptose 1-phosphate adenylyltransferase [bacterium]
MMQALKQWAGARVLIAGDAVLDRYVVGEVSRISPEAPVPVLKYARSWDAPGGASNVAVNARALGGQPLVLARVGKDPAGARLKAILSASGVAADSIFAQEGWPTSVKTRFLAGSHHLLRVDEEEIRAPDAATLNRLQSALPGLLKSVSVAVFSDYNKGLAANFGPEFVRAAKRARVRVIVDPKPQNAELFQGAFLMAPNQKEAAQMAGADLATDDELEAAGVHLLSKFRCEAIVITRGTNGMTLIEKGIPARHFPATNHEVYDVTGAGDTVAATLALALAAGMPLDECVQAANLAAGIVVQKAGTAAPTCEEFEAAEEPMSRKIVSADELLRRLKEIRRRDGKVVFTNGVFDLLHPGHVNYLKEARALGQALVVGLNTDRSARKLKGVGRPIQSESARADVLAALQAVDFVVLFDDETPIKLIRKVRPDILVKGGDYTPDKVIGREFVESYGGQVRILPYRDGHSTSRLIQKIRKPS